MAHFSMFIKHHFPIFISLLASVVLLYGITLPLAGQHDWNSVVYSNIARNHLRYGLLTTKLGMVTNFGQVEPANFGYFTHYPPLMPLLLAFSFAIFGINEWAARLVPILSAVVLVYFIFKLTAKLWNIPTAIIACWFIVFSPMLLYYSKIPVHETVVLGFLGFTFWAYTTWLKTNKLSFYYLTILGLILSQLTSWAGYYLSLYLPVHALIFKLKISHRRLFGLFLVAPLLFILHNLHMYWLAGSSAQESLWDVLLFRLNLNSRAQEYGITLHSFITRQAGWISLYFTRVMVILSSIWLIRFIYQRFKRQSTPLPESLILLLLVFGFTHNLVFRHLAHIHDYMLIYALPFFAISSAVILMQFYRFTRRFTVYTISLIILTLTLFSVERLGYVYKLFNSGQNNPGVALGKTIVQHTPPGTTTAITSPLFMSYYDVFIGFYADRNVRATATLDLNQLTDVDYLVIPKAHDLVTPAAKQQLLATYSSIDTPEALIINLRQPK